MGGRTTAAVVIVTWRRQFASSAWAAMAPEVVDGDEGMKRGH